ncbi:MAG: hypothetical protein B6I28_06400 [Fusobacteriia bacterium 4572_132]|nr:MAG: hypothetical protein B6I28_06400 [Fusobacteriia bacterium 4572_132]
MESKKTVENEIISEVAVEDAEVVENDNKLSFDELDKKISEAIEKNAKISEATIVEFTKKIVNKINDENDEFNIDNAIMTLSQVLLNLLSLLMDKDLSEDFSKAKKMVNEQLSQIIAKEFSENGEDGASLIQFLITSSAIIDFIYGRKIINDFVIKGE